MRALQTKFLCATNHKPQRLSVCDTESRAIYSVAALELEMEEIHETHGIHFGGNTEQIHRLAAIKFALDHYNWGDNVTPGDCFLYLHSGGTKGGMCHVWDNWDWDCLLKEKKGRRTKCRS